MAPFGVKGGLKMIVSHRAPSRLNMSCLLYTSDAADDTPCVDLGGRRIIKNWPRGPKERPMTQKKNAQGSKT